jgi:large subunit ribosomal protein L29
MADKTADETPVETTPVAVEEKKPAKAKAEKAPKAEKKADKKADSKPVEATVVVRESAADQLRELSGDELLGRLLEAKEELFNLRFQLATGQMDNNRRLRTIRHDIARIYTVMRECELGLSVGPDSEEGAA